jgi:uncharacterized protein (TIGR02284 family)
MMPSSDARALRQIARIAIDQSQVYTDAARMARDEDLKQEIKALAQSRNPLARELNERIGAHTPAYDTTLTGAMHDIAVNLRRLLGGRDHAVITEVMKGETSIIAAIEAALDHGGLSDRTAAYLSNLKAELEQERLTVQSWMERMH